MVRLATRALAGFVRCFSPFVRRVRVEGSSMTPTYAPGEYLWAVRRVLIPRSLRVGDVVVCSDPEVPTRELVKRVGEVRVGIGSVELVLVGDHREASRDSRAFGPVPLHHVKWVIQPHRPPRVDVRNPPTL